ncbi:hypothetical protein JCM1840_000643, partial [Sporobolomyces johnsonii]
GLKNSPPTPYTKPEPRAKPASTLLTLPPVPVTQVRKCLRDNTDDSVDKTTLKRSHVDSKPATTSCKGCPHPKKEVKNIKPTTTVAEKVMSHEVKNAKSAKTVTVTCHKAVPRTDVKPATTD